MGKIKSMLRRRCRVVTEEEYVKDHILTGGICRASWRRLAVSFMPAYSHFARRCRVIPDTSAACSAHFASQHRRKQHAVIGKPRLFTDHSDGITAERTPGDVLAQEGSRHAVANDDERFAHRNPQFCSS